MEVTKIPFPVASMLGISADKRFLYVLQNRKVKNAVLGFSVHKYNRILDFWSETASFHIDVIRHPFEPEPATFMKNFQGVYDRESDTVCVFGYNIYQSQFNTPIEHVFFLLPQGNQSNMLVLKANWPEQYFGPVECLKFSAQSQVFRSSQPEHWLEGVFCGTHSGTCGKMALSGTNPVRVGITQHPDPHFIGKNHQFARFSSERLVCFPDVFLRNHVLKIFDLADPDRGWMDYVPWETPVYQEMRQTPGQLKIVDSQHQISFLIFSELQKSMKFYEIAVDAANLAYDLELKRSVSIAEDFSCDFCVIERAFACENFFMVSVSLDERRKENYVFYAQRHAAAPSNLQELCARKLVKTNPKIMIRNEWKLRASLGNIVQRKYFDKNALIDSQRGTHTSLDHEKLNELFTVEEEGTEEEYRRRNKKKCVIMACFT